MSQLSKLKWRCRRGMKELDLLLNRYLDEHYSDSSSAEQSQFQALLELPDMDLYDYVLGRKRPDDPALLTLIEKVQTLALHD